MCVTAPLGTLMLWPVPYMPCGVRQRQYVGGPDPDGESVQMPAAQKAAQRADQKKLGLT